MDESRNIGGLPLFSSYNLISENILLLRGTQLGLLLRLTFGLSFGLSLIEMLVY